jgi:hypothetical protein
MGTNRAPATGEREVPPSMQIIVELPCGTQQRVLQIAGSAASAASVFALLGLDRQEQGLRLVTGSRYLAGQDLVPERVRLVYSVCGGKGGFGALLRGGPGGLRIKKTTNFDACRDLTGRRLRNTNAEEELRAWAAKQAEVEKAKKAALESKHRAKQEKKTAAVADFARETQQLQEATASALQKGLLKLQANRFSNAKQAAKRDQARVVAFFDDGGLGGDDDGDEDNVMGDNDAEDNKVIRDLTG